MIDQWRELKETITELRDNDGIATQQEVCKFLANYMDVLEKQMIDPIDRVLKIITEHISLLDEEHEGDAVVVVRLALQDLADEIKALEGDTE